MTAGWLFMTAWVAFNRLPRWVRICAYVWLSVFMLSRMGSDKQSSDISPADAKKLQTIAQSYQGSGNKADIAKLAAQIGQAFSDDDDQKATDQSAVLAVPFDASAGDPAGQTLTNTTFAQTYGRIAISSHGHVALADQPLSSADPVAAATLGRAHHASYVLYGAIDRRGGSDSRSAAGAVPAAPILTVTLVNVANSAVLWSKSYPLAGAVPATIAAEIDGHVPPISTSKGNDNEEKD
jgi:TolB-like protein